MFLPGNFSSVKSAFWKFFADATKGNFFCTTPKGLSATRAVTYSKPYRYSETFEVLIGLWVIPRKIPLSSSQPS